jgi:hypothetical protein
MRITNENVFSFKHSSTQEIIKILKEQESSSASIENLSIEKRWLREVKQ